MSSQIVLVTDGPEINVVENKDDVEVFIIDSQLAQEDKSYAKDIWKVLPMRHRKFVEQYMEPEWVEDLKLE